MTNEAQIEAANCKRCDGTGCLDHAGFAMEPCPECTLGDAQAENAKLRADLAANAEAMAGCEGCGAPLYPNDDFLSDGDVSGCWATMTCNHKSAEGTPCFAYRVGKRCAHSKAKHSQEEHPQ